MEVEFSKELDDLHCIEIGGATWGKEHRSVRNRFAKNNGGFNVRATSEIPMCDLVQIVSFVAEKDELPQSECAEIISALAASISRQCR